MLNKLKFSIEIMQKIKLLFYEIIEIIKTKTFNLENVNKKKKIIDIFIRY